MEKSEDTLSKDFQYFLDHQNELVAKYDGKVLLIVGQHVVGVYNSEAEAYFSALEKYEPGTFLIQLCTEGERAYTQVFHSNNVAFA